MKLFFIVFVFCGHFQSGLTRHFSPHQYLEGYLNFDKLRNSSDIANDDAIDVENVIEEEEIGISEKRSSVRPLTTSDICEELEKFAANMCKHSEVRKSCPRICRRGRVQQMMCGYKYSSGNKRKRRNNDDEGSGDVTTPNKRIIGGEAADQGEWNWQVSLAGKISNTRYLSCGGAILSPHFILTAAHCFYSNDAEEDRLAKYASRWTVTAGNHYMSQEESFESRHKVLKIIIHKDYSTTTSHSDIAILQLQEPINLRYSNRGAICLPIDSKPIEDDKECYIAGWGRTHSSTPNSGSDVLKELNVLTIARRVCNLPMHWDGGIDRTMRCAGIMRGGAGSCNGDSGGSLACEKDGHWFSAGVISFGSRRGCAVPNKPTVFADTTYFKKWITLSILKKHV